LEKSIERLLNMTEPVAKALPVNESDKANSIYDEVDDITYTYNKQNSEKGLVEYQVDGKVMKVIPENYQESEALAAMEELAEAAEEKESSGTSSSQTSAETSSVSEEEKTAVFTMMVHFGFDKWTLDEKSKNKVEVIVSTFQRHPNAKIEVVGHTDSKGPESYNIRLSKLRAQAVADYLVSKGVPRNKIITYGKGESEPIAPNNNPDGSDNPEGRAKNRRTEIKIIE
jgi:outer membrane protein OmpA-like peptidoglycan-associated protein